MNLLRSVLLFFLIPPIVNSQDNSTKEKLALDYYYKGLDFRPTQKDSSYHYFDTAFEYSKTLENYGDALEITFESLKTGSVHYDLEMCRFYLTKLTAFLEEDKVKQELLKVGDLDYYLQKLILEESMFLYNIKEYDNSKSKSQALYERFSKMDISKLDTYDFLFLMRSTNILASIYSKTGKYDLAESYFNRSLSFIKKNKFGTIEGYDRATNRLLSQHYIQAGQYYKADVILRKVRNAYEKLYLSDKKHKNSLVVVSQRLVNNLVQLDSMEQALNHLDLTLAYLIEEDPFYKQSFLLYGDIYTKIGNYELAFQNYQKSLALFQEYRQNKPHQDIAEVYGKIAELQLKQKNYQKGLGTIQKAFNAAGDKIQITDLNQNPKSGEVFSKTQLLNLLDIKLQLLGGSFEKTADAAYQNALLQTSHDILNTFDQLKSEFDSKLDKQFLADKAYPIFHRLLKIAYKAYEKKPSEEILELALNIAEKNKDFILLEALRNSQATQYGNVPQKVLDKEAQLRAGITQIEKQIFDATETESGFSDDLFKLKQEYYSFLDTIKINYPKYHELKYQNIALNLATVRENVLDNNSTLVSYTMTEEYLYAIVLDDAKEKFLKLSFSDDDRKDIRAFYKALSSPTIGDSQQAISDLGKALFAKTLKKPLEGFNTENLSIIPDGELHYLPFDLLQENGSYLLQSTSIGYSNSVASLLELKSKKKSEKNRILAFAPTFTGAAVTNTNRQFGKLLYNGDEVSKISAFYDTEKIMGTKATLENFKAKTSDFNVLHLATHASANDQYPDYSYLAFTQTKDSTTGNILYIKDLYNSTLNADMVTLSACQTGIGKLQKGQGMLSLSKGFYYAGAKSLVNSLWKINDKSTVTLMEYFYQGLSKGKSKTEALRIAKLKYLETTDDDLLRHPYYWAGFVVSGDASPLNDSSDLWWWLWLVPVTILGFWWLKKRKSI